MNLLRGLIACACLVWATAAWAASVRVVDGDTLEWNGETVRLWGIDAPEGSQRCETGEGKSYACGDAARDDLERILNASDLKTCTGKGRDRYKRLIATCTLQNGQDLGEALVREGAALDYPRYSKGHYAEAEEAARKQGRGVHQGAFEKPWEWRKTHQR